MNPLLKWAGGSQMSANFLKTCAGVICGGLLGATPLMVSSVQSTSSVPATQPSAPTPELPIAKSIPPVIKVDKTAAIVKLEVGGEICTAFFISPSQLLTADHCFIRSNEAVLTLKNKSTVRAQKERTVASDVALVSTSYVSNVFFEKGTGTPGAAIELKGWRLGVWTESNGNLTQKDEAGNWDYVANPTNQKGYSGSAIVQDGKYVAVNVGYRRGVNKNVAIPSEKIEL